MKRYWVNFGIVLDGKTIGTGSKPIGRDQTIQNESHIMEIANFLANEFRREMRIPAETTVSINVTSWQRFEEPELEVVSSLASAGLLVPH